MKKAKLFHFDFSAKATALGRTLVKSSQMRGHGGNGLEGGSIKFCFFYIHSNYDGAE